MTNIFLLMAQFRRSSKLLI